MGWTLSEIRAWGTEDGTEDVDTVLAEQGRDVVIATLASGHVGWDEGAINAGAHKFRPDGRNWTDEQRAAYYEAYAVAGRSRALEISRG